MLMGCSNYCCCRGLGGNLRTEALLASERFSICLYDGVKSECNNTQARQFGLDLGEQAIVDRSGSVDVVGSLD